MLANLVMTGMWSAVAQLIARAYVRFGTEVLLDFLVTVKAAPHKCEIRTGQP